MASRPDSKYTANGIQVSVWPNNVTINKSYKVDNNWIKSESFTLGDLIILQKFVGLAINDLLEKGVTSSYVDRTDDREKNSYQTSQTPRMNNADLARSEPKRNTSSSQYEDDDIPF